MSGWSPSYVSQHDLRQMLLDAAGEAGRYSLDDEQPMLLTWLCEGTLLDLLGALNSANGTRHFVAPADVRDDWYAYTSRNRQWMIQGSADATIDAATDTVTAVDGWRVSADAIVNRMSATIDEPSAPDWPTPVWDYQILPPLPRTVRVGAPLAISVAFADYVIDCPAVTVRLAPGSSAAVAYEHHGQAGDLTITAVGSDATVTAMSITGYIVDRAPSATHTADDAASQALPRGVREAAASGGDMAGPMATARGLPDHVVWRFADMPGRRGMLRPSVTLANWLPHAFRVDLYDTVAFTEAQLRVAGRVLEVVGLTETCQMAAPGGPVYWTHSYQLQERRLQPGDGSPLFFTLGTSALDGADVLAY